MDQNHTGMVRLRVSARSCQFDEVRNVEGYKDPALFRRQPKQLRVIKRLEGRIA